MMERGPAVSIVVAQKRQVIGRSASLKVGGDGFGDIVDKATQPVHFAQKASRFDDRGGRSDEGDSEVGESAESTMNGEVNVPGMDNKPVHQHPVFVIGGITDETTGHEIQEVGNRTALDGQHEANELQVILRAALPGQLPENVFPSRSTLSAGQMSVPANLAGARRVLHAMGKFGESKSFAPSVGDTQLTSSPPCGNRMHKPDPFEQQDALGLQRPAHWQDYGVSVSQVEPLLDPMPTGPASSPAQQISERLGRALAEASGDEGLAILPSAMRSLNIILQPDRLGAVQVSLTLQPEGLHVRIIASEAGTADMLRRDRHQLDGLLQPLAGDAQASRVTISIEAAKDGDDAAFLAESEPSSQFQSGPSDSGFRRSHPGAREAPATDKDAGGNDPSGGMLLHENVAPIRRRLPGVIVV